MVHFLEDPNEKKLSKKAKDAALVALNKAKWKLKDAIKPDITFGYLDAEGKVDMTRGPGPINQSLTKAASVAKARNKKKQVL